MVYIPEFVLLMKSWFITRAEPEGVRNGDVSELKISFESTPFLLFVMLCSYDNIL